MSGSHGLKTQGEQSEPLPPILELLLEPLGGKCAPFLVELLMRVDVSADTQAALVPQRGGAYSGAES